VKPALRPVGDFEFAARRRALRERLWDAVRRVNAHESWNPDVEPGLAACDDLDRLARAWTLLDEHRAALDIVDRSPAR
jgi:hypothetical protein